LHTYHIHIEGQVQGVGFRPFVYQLAIAKQLTGKVMNTLDGVHIYVNTSDEGLQNFIEALEKGYPERAVVTSLKYEEKESIKFTSFNIVHSEGHTNGKLLLTPDFALCKDCLQELNDSNDRRHAYPFITCTNCGPRFSITQKLPYDRELTTMAAFKACPTCDAEYNDVYDRRYYSQTNSCKTCGITLSLYNTESGTYLKNRDSLLDETVRALLHGKIVAVKGIGGFLLFCDASNDACVQLLRERKQRPHKPFALMYPSLDAIAQDVKVHPEAATLLTSEKAPIVLLENKAKQVNKISKNVAPDLNETGVMLPYSPLFALILKQFKKPLIATSANISGSPVIFKNNVAIEKLSEIADLILLNNRDIVVPQDDSVVRFDQLHQSHIIRRSRGLAPAFFQQKELPGNKNLLATGANMKSAFALQTNKQTYISQYLGSLDSFDAREAYQHTLQHFLNLFSLTQTDVVLTDKHEGYFATEYGATLANKWQVPIYQVQHHQAHFAAVLAENDLLHAKDKVLGVILDGTGLGDDGQIWGGEFFDYQSYQFNRKSHFAYLPYLLGDKMAKEPRLAALAFSKGSIEKLEENFTATEWKFYQKLVKQPAKIHTSSAGRLFDAVASILGIIQKNTFEGEAAMLLEAEAKKYLAANPSIALESLHLPEMPMQTDFILQSILTKLIEGESIGYLAACFHYTLAKIIEEVALQGAYKKIAFSGGVFQNTLLVSMIKDIFSDNFELYFHHQLSPNDENIAYGQLVSYVIENELKKRFLTNSKLEQTCV